MLRQSGGGGFPMRYFFPQSRQIQTPCVISSTLVKRGSDGRMCSPLVFTAEGAAAWRILQLKRLEHVPFYGKLTAAHYPLLELLEQRGPFGSWRDAWLASKDIETKLAQLAQALLWVHQ